MWKQSNLFPTPFHLCDGQADLIERLPALSAGTGLKSYVQREGEISVLNPAQTTPHAAIQPPEVTFRSGADQAIQVIPASLCFLFCCCDVNFICLVHLMQKLQSVLGCPAVMRAFLFHSYSEQAILLTLYSEFSCMFSLTNELQ
jgi:hypothetical protein